jgi:hypothetical protein
MDSFLFTLLSSLPVIHFGTQIASTLANGTPFVLDSVSLGLVPITSENNFFFAVLGFELRAHTLSHCTNPFS